MKKSFLTLAMSLFISLVFTQNSFAICNPVETNTAPDGYLLDFDWWVENTLHPRYQEISLDIFEPEYLKKIEIFDQCGNLVLDTTGGAYFPIYLNTCRILTYAVRVWDINDLYATVHVDLGEGVPCCDLDFDFWIETSHSVGDMGVVTNQVNVYVDAWDYDYDEHFTTEIYKDGELVKSEFGCCGASYSEDNAAPGEYVFTAKSFNDDCFITNDIIEPVYDQLRYNDAPYWIGERIQCEYYDWGGPGIAFNDKDGDFGNQAFRSTEDVDFYSAQEPDGTPVEGIGWVKDGEWWEYTVNINQAGEYFIRLRAATPNKDRRIRVFVNDEPLTALTYSKTGGWHKYQVKNTPNFSVPGRGKYTIRLKAREDGINLDWLIVKPANKKAHNKSLSNTEINLYPNPFNNHIYADVDTKQLTKANIIDMAGRVITENYTIESDNRIRFDFSDNMSSGIYFLILTVDGDNQILRIIKE